MEVPRWKHFDGTAPKEGTFRLSGYLVRYPKSESELVHSHCDLHHALMAQPREQIPYGLLYLVLDEVIEFIDHYNAVRQELEAQHAKA